MDAAREKSSMRDVSGGTSGSRMDAAHGRGCEVVGPEAWSSLTIGPGQADRAKPHGSRSFVRWALHMDSWGLAHFRWETRWVM
jgi:hypothetical protein